MSFDKNLKYCREKCGISQTKLAESVGVDPAFISHLERGFKKPGIDVLARISKELEVTTDELLGLVEISSN